MQKWTCRKSIGVSESDNAIDEIDFKYTKSIT